MHLLTDLHCHSRCSDGELSVVELVSEAAKNHVDILSITDHDTLDAYEQLSSMTLPPSLHLVPGIELSTQWQKTGIHVLGLNVQRQSGAMREAVRVQGHARELRAVKIAEVLQKAGLENALEGARKWAGSAALSRPHFARYMVETGFCKNTEQAFKKHLGSGKPCDIKQPWATLECVVGWIRDGGGVAVLAHPQHYSFTRSKLLRFLDDFKTAGGQGIEVLSGRQGKDVTEKLRDIAIEKKMLASLGSDFHASSVPGCRLGMHASLPKECTPVWSAF